jgi:hypothetical protein
MIAIKDIAREPSSTLGIGFVSLAIEEFQHGFSVKGCFMLAVGILGVLLREKTALPANGKRSTSVAVSAELKKEESNDANN